MSAKRREAVPMPIGTASFCGRPEATRTHGNRDRCATKAVGDDAQSSPLVFRHG